MIKQISFKVFFTTVNSYIKIIRINNKNLYNIIDMSKSLDYHKPGYLRQYYCFKYGDIKLIDNKYIYINDVVDILNRGKKSNCKKILHEILKHEEITQTLIIPVI